MNYLKLSLVLLLTSFAMVGCKSHKEAVVNANAEFNVGEIWILTQMQSKDIERVKGQKKIYIEFNPEAGTFNGISACNRYFGNFKDLGKGKMELSSINATKMACSDPINKVESNYMTLLRRCNGYNLGEYTLELTQNGKTLLTFEKAVEKEQ